MVEVVKIVLYGVFCVFVVYEVIRIAVTIYRNDKKNKAPVYTERAVAYHKHKQADIVFSGIHSSYVYYITFHTNFGEILKLYMTRDDYFIIQEGTAGQLTWQGDKLWAFVPEKEA